MVTVSHSHGVSLNPPTIVISAVTINKANMLVQNLHLVTLTASSFRLAFGDLLDLWQGAADEYKDLERCPGRLENPLQY